MQNRGTIKTIQKPEKYREALDSKIIYKILRKPEYEEIILNKYGFYLMYQRLNIIPNAETCLRRCL